MAIPRVPMSSPGQLRHGRDRRWRVRWVEQGGEPRRIDGATRQQLLLVNAGGDEEAVHAEALGGGEVGAQRIADGQNARKRRGGAAQLRGAGERRAVGGGMRLAGPEHLPAAALV